jgi:hypothetical protein
MICMTGNPNAWVMYRRTGQSQGVEESVRHVGPSENPGPALMEIVGNESPVFLVGEVGRVA